MPLSTKPTRTRKCPQSNFDLLWATLAEVNWILIVTLLGFSLGTSSDVLLPKLDNNDKIVMLYSPKSLLHFRDAAKSSFRLCGPSERADEIALMK